MEFRPTMTENSTNGANTFLAFGVLSPRKELEQVIKAFAAANRSLQRWELVIAGGEPDYYAGYRERLLALSAEIGVRSSVSFPGYVSTGDVPIYYDQADVFVQAPSFRPSASGPVSKAVGYGVPAILSNTAIYRELFTNGENALLVDPTSEGIAEGMILLASDETLRERLIAGTNELACQHSWDTVASETISLYREVVD